MDILISSNLERLLYELTGRDDAYTGRLMEELKQKGQYRIDDTMHAVLTRQFWGAYASEEDTAQSIRDTFHGQGVLIDPHTAVGVHVARLYRDQTGDIRPMLLASTASPFKFASNVLACLGSEPTGNPDSDIERLAELSGETPPGPLVGLSDRPVRHHTVCDQEEMAAVIDRFLSHRPEGLS